MYRVETNTFIVLCGENTYVKSVPRQACKPCSCFRMVGTRRELCRAVTAGMLVTLFFVSVVNHKTPPKAPQSAGMEAWVIL